MLSTSTRRFVFPCTHHTVSVPLLLSALCFWLFCSGACLLLCLWLCLNALASASASASTLFSCSCSCSVLCALSLFCSLALLLSCCLALLYFFSCLFPLDTAPSHLHIFLSHNPSHLHLFSPASITTPALFCHSPLTPLCALFLRFLPCDTPACTLFLFSVSLSSSSLTPHTTRCSVPSCSNESRREPEFVCRYTLVLAVRT
jgi:hypothetical protein